MENTNYRKSYRDLLNLENKGNVEIYWTIITSNPFIDELKHTIFLVLKEYYGDEFVKEIREVINKNNIYLYGSHDKRDEVFENIGYKMLEPINRSQLLDWFTESIEYRLHHQYITINTEINDTIGKFITSLVHEYIIELMGKRNEKDKLVRHVGAAVYEYDVHEDGYYIARAWNHDFENACTNYDTLKVSDMVKESLKIDEPETLDTYTKDIEYVSAVMDNEEARKVFNQARLSHKDLHTVDDSFGKLFNYYTHIKRDNITDEKIIGEAFNNIRNEVDGNYAKPKVLSLTLNRKKD